MPRESPSAEERAASVQSEEHARVEESRVSAPLPMGFGEAHLSAHCLVWRWVSSRDLAVRIAVNLFGLCLILLETIFSTRLAVTRCGYGDIAAGHSQGMITKDSPSVCASPRFEVGIISKLGCGNSDEFVWVVPSTTGDDMFQRASGPKVWIRRYCCCLFSRHDQRETLRLHSRRSQGGEAGRARRRR